MELCQEWFIVADRRFFLILYFSVNSIPRGLSFLDDCPSWSSLLPGGLSFLIGFSSSWLLLQARSPCRIILPADQICCIVQYLFCISNFLIEYSRDSKRTYAGRFRCSEGTSSRRDFPHLNACKLHLKLVIFLGTTVRDFWRFSTILRMK